VRLQLLARFGHNLTVEARDTYVPQADQVHTPSRLRAINETQHRVLGHIYLLINSEQRYPDDAIVQIMLEHDDQLLTKQAARAFEEAWNSEASV